MKKDPFKMLKEDHRKVEKLFKEMEDAGERAVKTREHLFDELKSELELHAEIEEQFMYPMLEESDETKDMVLEAYEEHKVVKDLLAELEVEEQGSDVWMAKLKVMKENVEHHVQEEEEELFPEAKDVLSDEQLQSLADSIEDAKIAANPGRKAQA